jgi:DNA-binding transcriptional LysR family regulator
MLEDLRALVDFAHAGSIAAAADRLFRTPSAITRQVQRLKAVTHQCKREYQRAEHHPKM